MFFAINHKISRPPGTENIGHRGHRVTGPSGARSHRARGDRGAGYAPRTSTSAYAAGIVGPRSLSKKTPDNLVTAARAPDHQTPNVEPRVIAPQNTVAPPSAAKHRAGEPRRTNDPL